MEKLVDDGLIDLIMNNGRIKPVNLQVEIHANFPNTKLVNYAHSVGLTVTAYAPLGSPGASPGAANLLTEQWVCDIAKRHKKTPGQVLLRYLLQRNLVVVPKSVTPARIVENSQACGESTSVPANRHEIVGGISFWRRILIQPV
ncbi:hypothetical protein AHF37_00248 [Paragonimus kellicotti]|nr:hypothetical protein AHF37_00248 [Paragonimus kellicotti]